MDTITVLQGDCQEQMRNLATESIDMVLTDPPYNTGMSEETTGDTCYFKDKKGTKLGGFFNDDYEDADYQKLANDTSEALYRVLKVDRPLYLFINWKSYDVWKAALENAGFTIKNMIVWNKMHHGLNYQSYAYQHEIIIYATKGHYYPLHKSKKHYTDVWNFRRLGSEDANEYGHETVKPLPLLREILYQASNPEWTILDPFGGSGSTAVACKQTGRSCTIIEREAKYIAVIHQRLSQHTLLAHTVAEEIKKGVVTLEATYG